MTFSVFLCCFFFSSRRRHTRCLSDWSSDVCSSDLPYEVLLVDDGSVDGTLERLLEIEGRDRRVRVLRLRRNFGQTAAFRSEERRVGKECRPRWAPKGVTNKEREARQRRSYEPWEHE